MPFIESAVNEAQEAVNVPEGVYDLRVQSVGEAKENDKGKSSFQVVITVEDPEYPNAAGIYHYISLVHPDDEPKTKAFKLLQQRRFLEAFNIDYSDAGFDTDDFPGATARLPVKQRTQEKDRDGQPLAEPRVFNELVLPRLHTEEAEAAPTGRRARR
jgi:hypothetical protein